MRSMKWVWAGLRYSMMARSWLLSVLVSDESTSTLKDHRAKRSWGLNALWLLMCNPLHNRSPFARQAVSLRNSKIYQRAGRFRQGGIGIKIHFLVPVICDVQVSKDHAGDSLSRQASSSKQLMIAATATPTCMVCPPGCWSRLRKLWIALIKT